MEVNPDFEVKKKVLIDSHEKFLTSSLLPFCISNTLFNMYLVTSVSEVQSLKYNFKLRSNSIIHFDVSEKPTTDERERQRERGRKCTH